MQFLPFPRNREIFLRIQLESTYQTDVFLRTLQQTHASSRFEHTSLIVSQQTKLQIVFLSSGKPTWPRLYPCSFFFFFFFGERQNSNESGTRVKRGERRKINGNGGEISCTILIRRRQVWRFRQSIGEIYVVVHPVKNVCRTCIVFSRSAPTYRRGRRVRKLVTGELEGLVRGRVHKRCFPGPSVRQTREQQSRNSSGFR